MNTRFITYKEFPYKAASIRTVNSLCREMEAEEGEEVFFDLVHSENMNNTIAVFYAGNEPEKSKLWSFYYQEIERESSDALPTFDEWVAKREHEMFEVEKFKRIGKEDDFFFQVLAFMGAASQKMSLAFTLTEQIEEFPEELKQEFRTLAQKYHDLQKKVRILTKQEI